MITFRKPNLLTDPIGSTLTSLTLPMIAGILSLFLFQLVDTFFIGKLGIYPLAAIGFIFPVTLVVINITIGLGIGTASVISRAVGAGHHQTAQTVATHSLMLSFVVALAIATIGVIWSPNLFHLMGATEPILSHILSYVTIWFLGSPCLVLLMVSGSILRATGDTKTPSLIMIIDAVINLILDPLLIFGIGPFPSLGMAGAAIASVFSWLCALIMLMAVLVYRDHFLRFEWHLPTLIAHWKHHLFISVPASLTTMLQPIAAMILIHILSQFGPATIAGFGIGFRLEPVLLIVAISLSTTLPAFIGQNWGANQLQRVHSSLFQSFKFIIVFQVIVYTIVLISAQPLAALFSSDPDVIQVTIQFLTVLGISYGFEGIILLTNTAFNTVNYPIKATCLMVVRLFGLMIPLAILLSTYFQAFGVIIAMVIANGACGLIALWWSSRIFRVK